MHGNLKLKIRQSLILLPQTVNSIVTNRIFHRFLMQTEKSKTEGKRIMLGMRFIEFPALSVDPRVRVFRSVSKIDN